MGAPIGVFDSGYGGLTILKKMREQLPDHDYLYLGDNARTPYGSRSFDVVYRFTLEAVKYLTAQGCPLIILACNTASAKALRAIQQNDLASINPNGRVLGVIRPSTEIVGEFTKTRHIGILATEGTVKSNSYPTEISKFFPDVTVHQEACQIWVPLVENGLVNSEGGSLLIKHHLDNILSKDPDIDTLVLGCTHYPLLVDVIKKHLPGHITLLEQGEIVARSLVDYLQRHPEIDSQLDKNGKMTFQTTERVDKFEKKASLFLGSEVKATQVSL